MAMLLVALLAGGGCRRVSVRPSAPPQLDCSRAALPEEAIMRVGDSCLPFRDEVTAVAYRDGEDVYFTGTEHGRVIEWDVATRKVRRIHVVGNRAVLAVAIGPHMIWFGNLGGLFAVDRVSGKQTQIRWFDGTQSLRRISASTDGTMLAVFVAAPAPSCGV